MVAWDMVPKLQLEQDNQRLGAENYDLRKQLADMALKLASATVPRVVIYPLVDKLGRHYRLERGVRCYPAQH